MSPERRRAGRRKLAVGTAREIKKRLLKHINARHAGRRDRFARKIGAGLSTVEGWLSESPKTPDPGLLIAIAKEDNISLNWLLLGEGPELRMSAPASGSVERVLYEAVIAELQSTERPQAWELKTFVPDQDKLYRDVIAAYRSKFCGWRESFRKKVGRKLQGPSAIYSPFLSVHDAPESTGSSGSRKKRGDAS